MPIPARRATRKAPSARLETRGFATLALLVSLLGGGEPLEGQQIPSPYRFVDLGQTVEFYTGWGTFDRGQFDLGPSDGPVFGALYAIGLSESLSFGVGMSYFASERFIIDPTQDPGERVVGTTGSNLTSLEAQVRMNLTGSRSWRGIVPFWRFGGGVAIDFNAGGGEGLIEPEDQFELGTTFIGKLGAGIQWFRGNDWTFSGGLDWKLIRLETPEGFGRAELQLGDVGENEWVTGWVATVGLTYVF